MEIYRFFAPASILIMVLAAAVLLTRFRGDNSMSMSLHAASHPVAYGMFASALSIGGILFYMFEFKWLMPQLKLPTAFIIFASIGLALQLIAAWVPDVPGFKRRLHRPSAYAMAAIMGVVVAFLAAAPGISPIALLVSLLALAIMAVIWFIFIVGSIGRLFSSSKTQYLIFQTGYVLVFFLAVLSATYL